MQNLINPPSPRQQPAGRAADLAEVTFFSQPPPPDPQLMIFKTYASWFAAILFAVIASFAVYSWLEASNVIGRLIGEDASRTQQPLEPLGAVTSRRKVSVPGFTKAEADESNTHDAAAADVDSAEIAAPVEATVTRLAEPDKALSDNKVAKHQAKAKTAKSSSSSSVTNTATHANNVLPPLPVTKAQAKTTEQPQQSPTNNLEAAFVPEAMPAQSEAEPPQTPAGQAKPKKHVIVTQIEPNKNKSNGAKVVSPVEDFFRRWKKSIKQGVTSRPCTQQEKALNQCYK